MIQYLFTNAALASVLTASVFLCGWKIRNVSIVHLLWVVVLLRFLAPPLLNVPFQIPTSSPPAATESQPLRQPVASSETSPDKDVSHDRIAGQSSGVGLSQFLVLIWSAGAVAVLVAATSRAYRLQLLVRRSGTRDENLQQHIRRVSSEMGLRHPPAGLLIRARISPMVWAWFSRPKMLVPVQLWSSLSEDEKTAVLRHELAHLRRRDHWVRIVEAFATLTHWWCPVLWWARRELHRYEERCCDSLAASFGPESQAALARACLQTVDFVGQRPPHDLQFGATRMAGFGSLRQRIQFILEDEPTNSMPRPITAVLFLVVPLLLVASPRLVKATTEPMAGGNAQVVSIPEPFERITIVGHVDVTIRYGKKQTVTVGEHAGPRPRFEMLDGKQLVIDSVKTDPGTEEPRPKIFITTPSIAVLEATKNALVSVHRAKAKSMVVIVDGSLISASGHCEALTVRAVNSGRFLAAPMTVANAMVNASRHSTVELGSVDALIQKRDATSRLTIGGR